MAEPHAPRGVETPRVHFGVSGRLRRRFGDSVDPEVTLPFVARSRRQAVVANDLAEKLRAFQQERTGERYMVLSEIGRGGMGVVLHVWDAMLRREVAMKVLSGSRVDEDTNATEDTERVQRFLEEAQVAGQLDHPGVIPVYDLGIDDHGQLYFTMPLIDGRDLQEVIALVHANEDGWSLVRALNVLLRVCEVISYAHGRGVIHRDLKPTNVMIGKFGETTVVDWGIAHVVGRQEPPRVRRRLAAGARRDDNVRNSGVSINTPRLTLDGEVLGTPAYMPPEQAQGRLEDIGAAADVYATGAMLYHLLSGRMPYVAAGAMPPAREVLKRVKRGPPTPLSRVAPHVPEELIAICDRAMARDPKDRYETMELMAEDLRAYLENRVVQAHDTGAWASAKKLILRNRAMSLSIALSTVVAVAALLIVTWVHMRVNQNLEAKNEELLAAWLEADEQAAAALEQKERAARLAREAQLRELEARRDSYAADLMTARATLRVDDVAAARRRLAAAPAEFRGWEWQHLMLSIDASQRTLRQHGDSTAAVAPLTTLAAGPQGMLVAGSGRGGLVCWRSGEQAAQQLSTGHGEVLAVSVVSDGSRVLSISSDGTLTTWDDESGAAERALVDPGGAPLAAAFAADAHTAVTGHQDGTLRIWDVVSGECRRELKAVGEAASALCVSPDGRRLAVAYRDGTVRVFRAADDSGPVVLEGHDGIARCLAFSPDGSRLVSGAEDGTIRLWSPDAGEVLDVLRGHTRVVTDIAFVGEWELVSTSVDATARLWDLREGEPLSILRGHDGPVRSVCVVEGELVATAGDDGSVKVWNANGRTHVTTLLRKTSGIESASFGPSGALVAAASRDRTLAIVELPSGQLRRVFLIDSGAAAAVAFLDANRVVTGSDDGTLQLWHLDKVGVTAVLRGHGGPIHALDVRPADGLIASASGDGTVRLWNADTLDCVEELRGHLAGVDGVAFAPTGDTLASASTDGTVRLWRVESRELLHTLHEHVGPVHQVAFSPDGASLASGGADGVVRLWSTSSGQRLAELGGHDSPIRALVWSPAGDRVVTGCDDGTLRILDPGSDEVVFVDNDSTDRITTVRFGPQGGCLLVGSAGAGLRILETRPESSAAALGPASPELMRADGERLLSNAWPIVASAHPDKSHTESALQWLHKARDLLGSEAPVLIALGAAHLRTGQLTEARSMILAGRPGADEPRLAEADALLALVHCALGEIAQARELAQSVRSRSARTRLADELIREVDDCVEAAGKGSGSSPSVGRDRRGG